MFIRRKHKRFQFTEKTHSKKGMLALALAAAILAVYVVFLFLAYRGAGTLSAYYGSAGIFALLGTFVALVLSIQSMREENSFHFFPGAALGVSLIDLLCWAGTYAYGFLLLYQL